MRLILSAELEGLRCGLEDKRRGILSTKLIEGGAHTGVLDEILAFCTAHGQSLPDIEAIAIVDGTGSFTTLRQATSVANTMNWMYGTKLVRLKTFRGVNKTYLPKGQFLQPRYSGEPNISKPK